VLDRDSELDCVLQLGIAIEVEGEFSAVKVEDVAEVNAFI